MNHLMFRGIREMSKPMYKKFKNMMQYRKQFLSLLVGVPSYEKYVEHMQSHHPDNPVKSRKEFFCEAQDARYDAKGGKVSRCC
jgi:uncharacterized short protein YbdD (DUF466 family)